MIILLALILSLPAHADEFEWDRAKQEKVLETGTAGTLSDTEISYRLANLHGGNNHMEIALEARWCLPAKTSQTKNCHTHELFRAMFQGYGKRPFVSKSTVLAWEMVEETFASPEADELTRTSSYTCWKFASNKTKFEGLDSCPKGTIKK